MIALARAVAARQEIDPALVCAVCDHESGGWNPFAIRYEAAFQARYVAPLAARKELRVWPPCSLQTEIMARSTSWGLMQVMGQVARELGFTGTYLSMLTMPDLGLEYGCRKLKRELERAKGDRVLALTRYNGGGDINYPAKVLVLCKKYKSETGGTQG